MTYTFSQHSLAQLRNAHPKLVLLCQEVIKIHDFKVDISYRDKAGQDAALKAGTTKLPFPKGKHNKLPSEAVDLLPFVGGVFIGWKAAPQWTYFGGLVLGVAHGLNIPIRWGNDWNQNDNLTDQNFIDAPHFELAYEQA